MEKWQQRRHRIVLCLYHRLSHCQQAETHHRRVPTRLNKDHEAPHRHRRVPTRLNNHLNNHEAHDRHHLVCHNRAEPFESA